MSENETGQTDLGGDILGVAKKVASAGDRWFVSFARGLGRAAGRLRKETDIVTSSAKSAAATTGRVTAKMVSRMKPRLGSPTPAPEKTGDGTAFDLLAAVAAHYALDLSVLRSNTEAVETIERLHRLCCARRAKSSPSKLGMPRRRQPRLLRSLPSGDDAGCRYRIQAALANKKAGGDKTRSSAERATVHPPEGQSQP